MSVQRSTRVKRALLLSVALHVAVLVPWWALRGAHQLPEESVELRFVWLDALAEAQPTPDAKVIAAADTQADRATQAPVTAALDQAPSAASRASAARRATALPQPTKGEERAQPLPASPKAKRDGAPPAANGALAMAQAQDVRAPRPAGRPHFEARPDQDVQETAADPWAASALASRSAAAHRHPPGGGRELHHRLGRARERRGGRCVERRSCAGRCGARGGARSRGAATAARSCVVGEAPGHLPLPARLSLRAWARRAPAR